MTDEIKQLEAPNQPVEDFDFDDNRKFLYKLRDQAMIVLDKAESILDEHEHPSAVATFSGLLKNIGEINNQILHLSKTHKELKAPRVRTGGAVVPAGSDGNGGTVNNTTNNLVTNVDLLEIIRTAQAQVAKSNENVDNVVTLDARIVDATAEHFDKDGNMIKEKTTDDGQSKVEPI